MFALFLNEHSIRAKANRHVRSSLHTSLFRQPPGGLLSALCTSEHPGASNSDVHVQVRPDLARNASYPAP